MKVYKIKVNGKVYEVEVEVSEKSGNIYNEQTNSHNEQTNSQMKSVNEASVSFDGEVVKSPMQGVIRMIKVKKGDKVQKGDVLLIFEAMKMENEILANVSGTIEEIIVSEGTNVNSNDPLLVIR